MHVILALTLVAGHLRKDAPLLNDAPVPPVTAVPAAAVTAAAVTPAVTAAVPVPPRPTPPAPTAPAEVHHSKAPASQQSTAAPSPPDLSAVTDGLGAGAAAVEEAKATVADTVAVVGTEAIDGAIPVHLPQDKEWQAHATEDARSKWGTVTYLATGVVTLAIWLFACWGKPRTTILTMRGSRDQALSGEDFAPVTLFSCCSSPSKFMCEACCCWGYMWAETMGRARILGFTAAILFACTDMILSAFHFVPLGKHGHFWVYTAAGLVSVLWFVFRVYARGRLRALMKQRSDSTAVCFDILVHFFCVPCAVAQETEFQQLYYQGTTDV